MSRPIKDNNGNSLSTGIVLSNEDNPYYFYSHSFRGITSKSRCVIAGDSFSQMDMVIFLGCKTANGGNGAKNLPTVFVEKGAKVAIGFSENIVNHYANIWIETFYIYLLKGYTVTESVNKANVKSNIYCAVICGDGNYRI